MSFFRRAGAAIARFFQSAADPAAEANVVKVYAKDVAGTSQLFARTDDGTINQLTPAGGADPAVIFDDSVPANQVNIRSDRASNQSPIDNTKAGITNLGSDTGVWGASTGATGAYSTIGGGDDNTAAGNNSTIGGGGGNTATATGAEATIAGGALNSADSEAAAIGGGYSNAIVGNDFAQVIAGGFNNQINGGSDYGVISGGQLNAITGIAAVIGGGDTNVVIGDGSLIAGGSDNLVEGVFSSVVGGGSNWIHPGNDFALIGGGDGNNIGAFFPADGSVIGGGHINYIDDDHCFIGGGSFHSINDGLAGSEHSAIVGGGNNTLNGNYGFIGGGRDHVMSGLAATIGGGDANDATGDWATVGGGNLNDVQADYGCIPGGQSNLVTGIVGHADGKSSVASGFISKAQGARANASRETQFSHASGDQGGVQGGYQVSWLVLRGAFNAPVGANSPLKYSENAAPVTAITLEANKAYSFRVRAICWGAAGVQIATIVKEFNVRLVAGIATIGAQNVQAIFGTATAVANWTILGRVTGADADVFVDFATGGDAATAGITVTAHVEFVEATGF
jgi:hypothetical protein